MILHYNTCTCLIHNCFFSRSCVTAGELVIHLTMDMVALRILLIHGLFALSLSLECPKCNFASNVDTCLQQNETCTPYQDVCIGMLREWKFTMGCGVRSRCQYDELQSTTDCRGNDAFKASDVCTVCCTGAICHERIEHVRKGLDKVAGVLHCPVCNQVDDPEKCMENIQPCSADTVTCEVTKKGRLYTSGCAKQRTCIHDHSLHPGSPSCLHDPSFCSVCCNDFSCLNDMLGVPPTEPLITPGVQISPGTEGPEIIPTIQLPTCHDETLFPCHTTKGACVDNDIASMFCKDTCGLCPAPTMQPIGQSTKSGSNSISNVVYCPDCSNESNPKNCLKNYIACRDEHQTCEIDRHGGLFSSRCVVNQICESNKNHRPSAMDCYRQSSDCAVCCHDHSCINTVFGIFPSTVPQQPSSAVTTVCKDKEFFPCQATKQDGACADPQFAKEFCPQTCGVCPPKECKDSTIYPCVLTAGSVCADHDLAISFCPVVCGLCNTQGGTATNPPTMTTTTTTTALPPHLQHPTLSCPRCDHHGLQHCIARTRPCRLDQDVCMATVLEWGFRMECSYSQFCKFKQNVPGATNCTKGKAYLPHEECYVCCTGDDCKRDFEIIKQSFESIPNTLHCPSCDDVSDPEDCLKSYVACSPLATTCLVTKRRGLYSVECNQNQDKCTEDNADPLAACIDNSTDTCQACCNDPDCLKQALHNPNSVVTTSIPLVAPQNCTDEPSFPCSTAGPNICADRDFSITMCPATCGHCGVTVATSPTQIPTDSPQTPVVNCKDDPGFPCNSTICSDTDFATVKCPVTCGICTGTTINTKVCKDDPMFPCDQSMCSDPDFSALTCPATCGHCTTASPTLAATTKVCADDPTFPCGPSFCVDPDFANVICPASCGNC